jgi:hypothetical protein
VTQDLAECPYDAAFAQRSELTKGDHAIPEYAFALGDRRTHVACLLCRAAASLRRNVVADCGVADLNA